MRRSEVRYAPEAVELLCRYPWPGNMRELENVMERLTILRAGDIIAESDIAHFLHLGEARAERPVMTRLEMEKEYFEEALARSSGVVRGPKGAAQLLGMRRSTLQYRIKKLGIDSLRFTRRRP